ncbi:MAG: hypothetical protein ACLPSW_27655 [Roseiarcus sp.]
MPARGKRGGPSGRDEDEDGRDDRERERHREHEREQEAWDDPAEHLEIERRRFAGGLPPTPELYALAREQWYRLPGVVVRPSMDSVAGKPASGEAGPPAQTPSDGKRPDR